MLIGRPTGLDGLAQVREEVGTRLSLPETAFAANFCVLVGMEWELFS